MLKSVDDSKARAVKGVVDIVKLPQGVAVLAKSTYAAIKGREEGAAVKSNRSLRIFRTVIKKPASPKGCRSNRRSAS